MQNVSKTDPKFNTDFHHQCPDINAQSRICFLVKECLCCMRWLQTNIHPVDVFPFYHLKISALCATCKEECWLSDVVMVKDGSTEHLLKGFIYFLINLWKSVLQFDILFFFLSKKPFKKVDDSIYPYMHCRIFSADECYRCVFNGGLVLPAESSLLLKLFSSSCRAEPFVSI